jgi:hypothetical protein
MEAIQNIIATLTDSWVAIVGGITVILTAIIAICELIPGEQPEKALKKAVEWLAKFSRK